MELKIGDIVRVSSEDFGEHDYTITRVTKTKAIGENGEEWKQEFKKYYSNTLMIGLFHTRIDVGFLLSEYEIIKEELQAANVYRMEYEERRKKLTQQIQKHIDWGEVQVTFVDGKYSVVEVDNPDRFISVENFYKKLGDRNVLPKLEFI